MKSMIVVLSALLFFERWQYIEEHRPFAGILTSNNLPLLFLDFVYVYDTSHIYNKEATYII